MTAPAGAAVDFEVTHTPRGVRRAVRELWDARHRRSWWLSMAIAVILMTTAFATRELPWYLAVPLTVVILHAAFLGWHRDHVTKLMARALEQADPPVFRYRIGEAGLAESSPLGSTELPWSSFAGMKETREFVFLLRAPLASGQFVALPRAQVPEAAHALLRGRLAPV